MTSKKMKLTSTFCDWPSIEHYAKSCLKDEVGFNLPGDPAKPGGEVGKTVLLGDNKLDVAERDGVCYLEPIMMLASRCGAYLYNGNETN